ncbi:MAG: serine/threonine protein kinase [Candidatus Xenobia bacterium]
MPILTPDTQRYKPVALLKEGRFSTVVLLRELATDRHVVGRMFKGMAGGERDLLAGLDVLAERLARLSHPSLPRLLDSVDGKGGTWFLFEATPGVPASDYFGREAEVDWGWIVTWLAQIAGVLAALHGSDPPFVVGSFDPTDVLLDGPRAWLVDLGLTQDLFAEQALTLASPAYLHFIAPEARMSVRQQPSADIYSLGAVTYWLLTGHAPVAGRVHADLQLKNALSESRPDLPAELLSLVCDMLWPVPDGRPLATEIVRTVEPFVPDTLLLPPLPAVVKSEVKFVARSTRLLTPGVEQHVHKPFSRAPEPLEALRRTTPEREPTAPGLHPFQEFLEDFWWQVSTGTARSRLATASLLLAAALVLAAICGTIGAMAQLHAAMPHPDPPHLLSGHPRQEGNRLQVAHGESALLEFGHHSHLRVGPDSVLILDGMQAGTLKVHLDAGSAEPELSDADGALVQLPGGQQVRFPRLSHGRVTAGDSVQVVAWRGMLWLTGPGGDATLPQGHRAAWSEEARRFLITEAAP